MNIYIALSTVLFDDKFHASGSKAFLIALQKLWMTTNTVIPQYSLSFYHFEQGSWGCFVYITYHI